MNILPTILHFLVWHIGLSLSNSDDLKNCCASVYVFGSEAIEDNQSAVLGIYRYEGQHEDRPYYSKNVTTWGPQGELSRLVFLLYKENATYGDGHPGWIVSEDLNGTMYFIVTRSRDIFSECPVGLTEAYDRDLVLDQTFLIECHTDTVVNQCDDCMTMNVTSSDMIAITQPVRMGEYIRKGDFNGYPTYFLSQYGYDSYLYFRKKGRTEDGWTIGAQLGMNMYSVLTQNRAPCPQKVIQGYTSKDNQIVVDNTLSIICSEQKKSVVEEEEFDLATDNVTGVGKIDEEASSATTPATSLSNVVLASIICLVIVIEM